MILSKTDIVMLGLTTAVLAFACLTLNTSSVADSVQTSTIAATTTNEDSSDPVTQTRASTILPKEESIQSTLPDFSAYQDVRTKKREFFNYMLPMIRNANNDIRLQRNRLLAARDDLRAGVALEADMLELIGGLSRRYRVSPGSALLNNNTGAQQLQIVQKLLLKVDVVPESLVLAQAANESGWGTSRFARKANNLFGVWCFTKGCGLTPLSRDAGLTHEVARYDTVQQSVAAYMRTINTHAAYKELRQIRAESRAGEEIMSGLALAEGLLRYSERGLDYVREIQQMIRVNDLHRFNQAV